MNVFNYIVCALILVSACSRKTPAANTTNDTKVIIPATTATPSAEQTPATTDAPTQPDATKETAVPAIATLPKCIQQKIDSIKQLPVWNPPAVVEEYQFKGKSVFVFSADCCDFFSTAYDENCNYICAPSGGFTGKGDNKCPDFIREAKMIRVAWRDTRKKSVK